MTVESLGPALGSPRGLLFFGHLNKITMTVTVTVSTKWKGDNPSLSPTGRELVQGALKLRVSRVSFLGYLNKFTGPGETVSDLKGWQSYGRWQRRFCAKDMIQFKQTSLLFFHKFSVEFFEWVLWNY